MSYIIYVFSSGGGNFTGEEDTIANRLVGSTTVLEEIIPINTTVMRVLTTDVVLTRTKYSREPSYTSEFKLSSLFDSMSPKKAKGKNIMRVFYPKPNPDKDKLLGIIILKTKHPKRLFLRRKIESQSYTEMV